MKQIINRLTACAIALSATAVMEWGSASLRAQTTPMLLTDSVGKVVATDAAEATVSMAWPVTGPKQLVTGVRQFIINQLCDLSATEKFNSSGTEASLKSGAKYKGKPYDGHAVAAFYAEKLFDNLEKEVKDLAEDGVTLPPFSDDVYIEKVWEGEGGVSYTVTNYIYEGGAHGLTTSFGQTLDRATGNVLVEVIDRSLEATDSMQAIIRDGLTSYFADELGTDSMKLEDFIFADDPSHLPLPVGEPWFTDEGLTFIYQQYEIAPYAAGRPSFVVPYARIEPYLTADARKLVPAAE